MAHRPNVVIILTDHQGVDSLACYGHERHSPATDRLAKEGMCFTHATTTTGICAPARCAMQTGYFAHYLGIPNNLWSSRQVAHSPGLLVPPEFGIRTIPSYMKEAGYLCGLVGKLHMSGSPPKHGYDDYLDFLGGAKDRNRHIAPRPFRDYLAAQGVKVEGPVRVDQAERGIRFYRSGKWHAMSARLLDYAAEHTGAAFIFSEGIRLIEAYARTGQPFLAQIHLSQEPHWPYIVPEPYANMYDPGRIPPWPNFDDQLSHHPLTHRLRREAWLTQNEPWARWAESISKHYGMCAMVEDQAARLLACLDRLGVADNTMVIWTADHGAPNGAHGVFDKDARMIDELYRIPMLVRWPAGSVAAGTVSDQFVQTIDILPTLLEMARAPVPPDLHGKSMLPILRGDPDAPKRDYAFWTSGGDPFALASVRGIRTERFKYIYNAYDMDEFYDLELDPAEMTNRIDDPKYQDEIQRLKKLLRTEMERTGDPLTAFSGWHLLREGESQPPDTAEWTISPGESYPHAPEMVLADLGCYKLHPKS
ncbi:MAG: sulfatase-like hydrolase/transferase [Planctomycetota bacterium]